MQMTLMAVNNDVVIAISTKTRQLRQQAGLSRIDLARLAGVGKTAVFDIEHAKPTVQLDTLLKVLTALNLKLVLETPL
jgi:transcriptional regulator with XRE-family HTH domain